MTVQLDNKQKLAFQYYSSLLKNYLDELENLSMIETESQFKYLLRPCDYSLKSVFEKINGDVAIYRWEFNKFLTDINSVFNYIGYSKNNVMCHRIKKLERYTNQSLFVFVKDKETKTTTDTITCDNLHVVIGYTTYLGVINQSIEGTNKSGFMDISLFKALGLYLVNYLQKNIQC